MENCGRYVDLISVDRTLSCVLLKSTQIQMVPVPSFSLDARSERIVSP
mgnify:CR=1 FL=1